MKLYSYFDSNMQNINLNISNIRHAYIYLAIHKTIDVSDRLVCNRLIMIEWVIYEVDI